MEISTSKQNTRFEVPTRRRKLRVNLRTKTMKMTQGKMRLTLGGEEEKDNGDVRVVFEESEDHLQDSDETHRVKLERDRGE